MNMDIATAYIEEIKDEALALLKTLAVIPAPSGKEEKRATFIKNWFEREGIDSEVDQALNVVVEYRAEEGPLDLFLAHTDIVFPDLENFVLSEKDDLLATPGIGDDTANVVALMLFARYIIKNQVKAKRGVVFAFNSCEEGEGNLKGAKEICHRYEGRIKSFTSFDCDQGKVVTDAVGCSRYAICIHTEGGHSYSDFGARNAIVEAARFIEKLSRQCLPETGRTTFNFGTIGGGTTINSIASEVVFTYEYRSDDKNNLRYMEENFSLSLAEARESALELTIKNIGERPCSKPGTDSSKLINLASSCLQKEGIRPYLTPSSTDCNIPLSLGIPSVAFGLIKGYGAHTRGEKVIPSTYPAGLRAGLNYLLKVVLED